MAQTQKDKIRTEQSHTLLGLCKETQGMWNEVPGNPDLEFCFETGSHYVILAGLKLGNRDHLMFDPLVLGLKADTT